jgi:hypothetical protein
MVQVISGLEVVLSESGPSVVRAAAHSLTYDEPTAGHGKSFFPFHGVPFPT